MGLPEGIGWSETPGGIVLYNETDSDETSPPTKDLTIANTNNATIENNVSVYALTGDNKVLGDEGAITTGDAYAGAQVTNVANTNILGQNWALLVFDIFGDWGGDLMFGQPDLWIGAQATPRTTPIMPGTDITYTYTITNRGDATASQVRFEQMFHKSQLHFKKQIKTQSESETETTGMWELGDIKPGETKTVSYETKIQDTLSLAHQPVTIEATVTAAEDDADYDDNTEIITVYSGREGKDKLGKKKSFASKVEVEKTASTERVMPGEAVDYTITITNHGGPLFRSLLRDTLVNEAGEMVREKYWQLGTIATDETVSVTYTMEFGEDIAPGVYTNNAQVLGLHTGKSWQHGKSYESSIVSEEIVVGGMGDVLGVNTDSCPRYLTDFMRHGIPNNVEEVMRLQRFLNTHVDTELTVDGVFDQKTEQAVQTFQRTYREDILTPWGMSEASGYVYLTTRKKINELSCNNEMLFPLTELQMNEIETYRNTLDALHDTTTDPLPVFGDSENEDDITLHKEHALPKEVTLGIEKKGEVFPRAYIQTQSSTKAVADTQSGTFLRTLTHLIHWVKSLAQR